MNPDGKSPQHVSIGRELAVIALAYAGLTIVVTWPVVAHLTDAVAGFAGHDSFQYIWLFWWFREALLNRQQLPSDVNILYYPQGASHPFLWMHPLVPFLGLPLTGLLGPALTYNLFVLASFVAVGITGYLLTRLLTRQPHAAFVGGLILAFAPNRMGHTLAGHLPTFFNAVLPLYVLALWLWLKRPHLRSAGLYTISLILVLLSYPMFISYFLLLVTPVLLVAYWFRQGRFSRRQWRQLFMCWMVSGFAFLPFAWPLLVDLVGNNLAYLQPQDIDLHSADLVSFFVPSPFHPLWANSSPVFPALAQNPPQALEEGFNYIGLAALALIGIAVWRRRRQVGPWLVIAGLAILFSLGPTLSVGGHVTQFTMPYALLSDIPFFSWSRTPGRLNMTTMLAVSVLGAQGVARIMRWCRRSQCRWGLLVVIAGFIVFEYLPLWPFPLDFRPVSAYYRQLAQFPAEEGLLELPETDSDRAINYAMYYQTVHHRPLVGGYITRDPPGTVELRVFAGRLLSPARYSDDVVLVPSLAQRVAILRDLGVTEVVAHPTLMTGHPARAIFSFLPEILGEPYYADEDLLAWRVPPAEVALPPYALFLNKNWEAVNNDGSLLQLMRKREGLLFIYAARAGPARLTIEVLGPSSPGQELWVDDLGPLVIDGERVRYYIPLHLRARLNWLHFRLTGCEDCDVRFSRIAVE